MLAHLALPQIGTAQIRLLKDINQSAHPNPGSKPQQFVQMNGWTYFQAVHSAVGSAFFRTNGNPASTQLVKAIWPGPITVFKNRMYFSVRDSQTGSELWSSDGTPAGTRRILDMMPGPGETTPAGFAELGGSLYFAANHPTHGRELFVTDGTASGTKLVKDIAPGTASSNAGGMIAIGKWIWFQASDGVRGSELWRTDGTTKGTVMVQDIAPGAASSFPAGFTAVGNTVCFTASVDGKAGSLFRTDGTAAGTKELHRFMKWTSYPLQRTVRSLQAFGNRAYFVGLTATQGWEAWITDGTVKGTKILKDIAPGTRDGASSGMVALGGHFYFIGNDGTRRGAQVFQSDGTTSGTIPLAPNASYGLGFWDMAATGNRLFFVAVSPTYGTEVWVSDGTAGGTALLRDIQPGTPSSFPKYLTPIGNGRVVFQANDGKFGEEPWYSDGTAKGTVIAGDAYKPKSGTLSSYPRHLFDHNGVTFFSATTTAEGESLWKTDGTAAGTVMVKDFVSAPYAAAPRTVASAGDEVLVTAMGSNFQTGLWRSNGSTAGTVLIRQFWGRPTRFFSFRNTTLFVARTAAGVHLWSSDGTTTGTRELVKITNVNRPLEFASIGRLAYFTMIDFGYKLTLWQTDGTPSGTKQVVDLGKTWTKHGPTWNDTTHLHAFGDRLIFQAKGELWTSDGTAAGTKLVADLNSKWYSIPEDFTTVGDSVFFTATDGIHGYELWKTDGTKAGTVLVKDIRKGSGSALDGIFRRVNLDDRLLLFAAADNVFGLASYKLWRSDGTAAGTYRVADVYPYGFSRAGSRFATFAAHSQAAGHEMWRTDGSRAGTTLVQDYNRGPANGGGGGAVLSNGRMLFSGSDGLTGSELAVLDLRAVGVASSQPRGYACGATGNPTLHATDAVLGKTLRVSGRGAATGARGALVLSLPSGPLRFGNCQLDVDPAAMFYLAAGIRPTGGAWSKTYPVANSPSLLGLGVVLQAGFGPTAGPFGMDLTNSVLLVHGR